MKRVDWLDEAGRWHASAIPEGVSDTQAPIGVPLGPPDLSPLGLPEEIEVRVHNALFHRGLLTAGDLRNRMPEVQAALMSALRLNAQRIEALYSAPAESPPG